MFKRPRQLRVCGGSPTTGSILALGSHTLGFGFPCCWGKETQILGYVLG